MNKLRYILILILFISSLLSFSQEKGLDKCYLVAVNYIQKQNSENTILHSRIIQNNNDDTTVVIYDLSPQGFILIGLNSKNILGFSFENNFAKQGSNTFGLAMDLIEFLSDNQYNVELEGTDKAVNEMYGPYVYNMWGQVNCSDNTGTTINVTNLHTPSHYAAGCVAISQTSILKHYEWPPRGMGSYSYTDNSGNSTGFYAVSHKDFNYDWNSALDRYRGKASNEDEREIAGLAAYHSAVSLQMDFESNGSTSNVNRIPGALATNFRFTALYKARSSSTFWTILDSNMVWEKPVVLAVENSSGNGHSVVCDGLKIEDGEYLYHLNMGWWGTSNGWYKIRSSFNAGGYNYVIGAAMNILPEPYIENPILWNDGAYLDLCWSHPENAHAEAFELQRSINGGSWETLNDNITDTCWTIFPQAENEYSFRVRAKTNSRWYNNSWSETVQLIRAYTGIDDLNQISISTQPNPFNNHLLIESDINGLYELKITNYLGQIIYSEQSMSNQLLIESSSWPSGIYFIQLNKGSSNKTIKCLKY